MALTRKAVPKKKPHKKKTRQGAGTHTKWGKSKTTIKKYRGQGGKRKSIKR
jgi:hypothetical protein